MRTKTAYLFSILFFIFWVYILPGKFISSELGGTILTISTFLFGLLAGFYIVVTTTDYNSIKNILAAETAGWISLYNYVLIYDAPVAKKLSALIDKYVIHSFDFEIIDYAKGTVEEFEAVKQLIYKISFKQNKSAIYENLYQSFEGIINSRQQLTVLGTRALSIFQWIILVAIGFLVIFSLYGLRTGEIFFDIVTVLISSSIVLILFLIRDLDIYIWNEKTFGYDIFENVLISIGKLPYYPAESIQNKRISPVNKEYRVGTYIDYPKTFARKMENRTYETPDRKTKTFDSWK